MRYAGHVVRKGERGGVYRVSVGNLRERDWLERDHLGDPNIDGKLILRWLFRTALL